MLIYSFWESHFVVDARDLVLVVVYIYVSWDIGLLLCQLVFATICCFRLIVFLFSFHPIFNVSMLIYSFWESDFVASFINIPISICLSKKKNSLQTKTLIRKCIVF